MKIANTFRSAGFDVLGTVLRLAADHTVLAQHAAGHAAAGSGRAGAAVGRPGAGYGAYGWRGGDGWRGYGWGGGWGWRGGWGWGPGWGWWPLGIYASVLPWYYST